MSQPILHTLQSKYFYRALALKKFFSKVFALSILLLMCGCVSLSACVAEYPGVQAVIFDCDGVLVDTEYLKFLAWRDALANHGVDFSIEEYMPLVGHSSKNILQMIGQSKNMMLSEKIIELKNTIYKAKQKQGVPPIQAMIDFVHQLSANKDRLGIKLALASSAPKQEILYNLQQIDLTNAFDLVLSGSDDLEEYKDAEGTNKPKPYIYIEASKRLQVPPELCLVFEDTEAGVNAAHGAGMIAIAVPNQFTINQDFSKAVRILRSHQALSINSALKRPFSEKGASNTTSTYRNIK